MAPDSPDTRLHPDETKESVPANALIELSNGKEVLRQVTGANGEFSFSGLRPGEWMLKAYDDSLPAHYYFEIPEAQLELKPGAVQTFTFKAVPKIRPIQIVEEGTIGPEGAVVSTTDYLPVLDDLFAAEYYFPEPSGPPRDLLERADLLRKDYLYHGQYYTDTVYIVKKGDTLTGIADKFKVPLQRIIDLNYLGTTGMVEVDSVLIIPVPVEYIYVAGPNETLEEIAKKHGTTVEILADLNNITESDRLETGQSLVLPAY